MAGSSFCYVHNRNWDWQASYPTEVEVVVKSVIKEEPPKGHVETSNVLQDDDGIDEENNLAGHPTIHIGDEEDVSFSDLEEDDVKWFIVAIAICKGRNRPVYWKLDTSAVKENGGESCS